MNIKQAADMLGVSDTKQVHVLAALKETYSEVQTSYWKPAMLELADSLDDAEAIRAIINGMELLPDAFVINKDAEGYELVFFEVEVHSPMSGDKLRAYGKFAIDLGFYGIGFAVLTVNKYGHINKIDLLPYYVDWLKRNVQ